MTCQSHLVTSWLNNESNQTAAFNAMVFAAPMRFRTLMKSRLMTCCSGACLRTSAGTTRRGGIRTSRRTTARLVMTAKAVKHAYCTHPPTPIGDLSIHQRPGAAGDAPVQRLCGVIGDVDPKASASMPGLPDTFRSCLHVCNTAVSRSLPSLFVKNSPLK